MRATHITSLLLSAASFVALTGARGCSAGVSAGTGYSAVDYYEPAPVVVVSPGPVTPVLLVGDVALTVMTPGLEVPGTTQSFRVVVRADSAYGPVVLDGADFVFDANGVAPVDLTDLPYGLYDIEITGFDAWGGVSSYGAATVILDEGTAYVSVTLESSLAVVTQGDVALDLVAPDGGAYAPPIDTIDYYLWAYDPSTDAFTFIESVGYIPFDPYAAVVVPGLGFGSYYIEVDAFDVEGFRIYTYAGNFYHAGELTTVSDVMDYAP